MERFEHIFMDEKKFNEKGIDNSKFKNIKKISSFQIVEKGVFCYIAENLKQFSPIDPIYEIKEIKIPTGKILIIGYYE